MAAVEKEKTNKVNIYSMEVHAKVNNRFARTLVTSKVRNEKTNPEETTFSIILPENAYISEFEMEIDGKIYKAYVKEKEEAKDIYQQAVSAGKSAGHVELKARDSEKFTVSVNVEPQSETIFRLVYEELLQRRNGRYELVINIHPGQIVEHLDVEVIVEESRPLTFIKAPSLRSGKDILKDDKNLDPSAVIDIINNNYATVKFNPDINQQMKFGKNLGGDQKLGLAGQFVVQYDVERDPQGGEVLIREGYFVHFFAPSELETLPKHIVFVLDHSGSMGGRKIEQLTEAMENILSELNSDDLFNIVLFSYEAAVWNVEKNAFFKVDLNSGRRIGRSTGQYINKPSLPEPAKVTKENIEKAKIAVKNTFEGGSTNMMDGLQIGLLLTKTIQEKMPGKCQPMIVCLTDGQPDHGTESILKAAEDQNIGTNRAAIFSLSFGEDADKDFLKKLSVRNLGFSRHIYEAADASLQLQEFYSLISSPLLNNVVFKYVDEVTEVTDTNCPIFFQGSEFVVAGRIGANLHSLCDVNGLSTQGSVTLTPECKESAVSLERLWAYLTIKQLLDKAKTKVNSIELKKKALDLALKYSFVTSVSSLVVVKPEKTQAVGTERADIESYRSCGQDLGSLPSLRLNFMQNSSCFFGGASARTSSAFSAPMCQFGSQNSSSAFSSRMCQFGSQNSFSAPMCNFGSQNSSSAFSAPMCNFRSQNSSSAFSAPMCNFGSQNFTASRSTLNERTCNLQSSHKALFCFGSSNKTLSIDDNPSENTDEFYNYINNTFEQTFHTQVRLSKKCCLHIYNCIKKELALISDLSSETPMNILVLTLASYGSHEGFREVANTLGIAYFTARAIVGKVSKILAELHPQYVKMPRKDEIQKIQEKFYQIGSFPKVIGVIGGTHIPINLSLDDNKEILLYKNQKGNLSIKCQIVCDSDMRIIDIFAQSPGSETDEAAFKNSKIKTQFDNGDFHDCILLGGEGYATRNYLLTPITDAVTLGQKRYNESHSKSLSVVEKFFNSWKKRFPVLVDNSYFSEDVHNIILATAVLHNIALELNDGEAPPLEGISKDVLEDLIKQSQIPEVVKNDELAKEIPNKFVNDYFSN